MEGEKIISVWGNIGWEYKADLDVKCDREVPNLSNA